MEAHRHSGSTGLVFSSKESKNAAILGFFGGRNCSTIAIMTNDSPIRILTIDDHPLFRQGIAAIINCQADMSLVGAASNGTEAIDSSSLAAAGRYADGPQSPGC